jgi:hypothetical protein
VAAGEDDGKCDFVVEDFSWISGAPPAGLTDPDRFEVCTFAVALDVSCVLGGGLTQGCAL